MVRACTTATRRLGDATSLTQGTEDEIAMVDDAPRKAAPDDGSATADGDVVSAAAGVEGRLPGGRGAAILVVDDEALIRALVARALAHAGFDVATAASGKEALRLVAEGRVVPAVLVTDIEMPEMNGVELAARLLAMRPAIRVVMMTGDPDRAESARRHPSIVDAVALKPFRMHDLVQTVESAVRQPLIR